MAPPRYNPRHHSVAPSAYSVGSVYSYYSTVDEHRRTDNDYYSRNVDIPGDIGCCNRRQTYKWGTVLPDTHPMPPLPPFPAGLGSQRGDARQELYCISENTRPALTRRPTKRETELKAQCTELLHELQLKEAEIQKLKGQQRDDRKQELDSPERKMPRLSTAAGASVHRTSVTPRQRETYRPTSIIYFGASRPSYVPTIRHTDALLPEDEAMKRAREEALRNLTRPKPAVTIPSTPLDIVERLRSMALEEGPRESRPPDTSRRRTQRTPRSPRVSATPKSHGGRRKSTLATKWENAPPLPTKYDGGVPFSPTARLEERQVSKSETTRRPVTHRSSRMNLLRAKLWDVRQSTLERARDIRDNTQRAGRGGLSMMPLPTTNFSRPLPDVPVSPCNSDPSTTRPPELRDLPQPATVPSGGALYADAGRQRKPLDKGKGRQRNPEGTGRRQQAASQPAAFVPLDDRMAVPRSEVPMLRNIPPRTNSSLRRANARSKGRQAENKERPRTQVKQDVIRVKRDDSVDTPPTPPSSRSSAPSPARTSSGASHASSSPGTQPSTKKHILADRLRGLPRRFLSRRRRKQPSGRFVISPPTITNPYLAPVI